MAPLAEGVEVFDQMEVPVMPETRLFHVDSLCVRVFDTRQEMGAVAAREAADTLRAVLAAKASVSVVFAAAPSQNEFLAALCEAPGIDWSRVHAFHMDEYIGLPADAPQLFARFLKERLFDRLPFGRVSLLDGTAVDPHAECVRYAALLAADPPDIVCLGIGENGHIAFNDPPDARFEDPQAVRIVMLDETCRSQQVHDGCFATLAQVPTHAITLTVPALVEASALFCMVPAATKAAAVRATLEGPVTEGVPATILRRHPAAVLYLDRDSASQLSQ